MAIPISRSSAHHTHLDSDQPLPVNPQQTCANAEFLDQFARSICPKISGKDQQTPALEDRCVLLSESESLAAESNSLASAPY